MECQSDDQFQKILLRRNASNYFANRQGMKLTELQEGYAVAEMETTSNHLNPNGFLHGGCLFTIADVACAGAVASYDGERCTTLDASIQYLRAGKDVKHLTATAHVVKRGRRVTVLYTEIFDQNHTLLCIGTFNYMTIPDR